MPLAVSCNLQPAAKHAGITEGWGFRALRHTCSTLLKANGEEVRVPSLGSLRKLLNNMASTTGFEPATSSVSNRSVSNRF